MHEEYHDARQRAAGDQRRCLVGQSRFHSNLAAVPAGAERVDDMALSHATSAAEEHQQLVGFQSGLEVAGVVPRRLVPTGELLLQVVLQQHSCNHDLLEVRLAEARQKLLVDLVADAMCDQHLARQSPCP